MAGKVEGYNYTPWQINELREARTIADAEAIKRGAKYIKDGEFYVTEYQKRNARVDMQIFTIIDFTTQLKIILKARRMLRNWPLDLAFFLILQV